MAIENVMLGPLKLLKMERQAACDEAIGSWLSSGLRRRPRLSRRALGGQKQRVAIARLFP
jgi:ABC-type polar amino acid transport system ATPase subunit